MRKHNPYLLYQLARTLTTLNDLPKAGGEVIQLFHPLYEAQSRLRSFIGENSILTGSSKRAIRVLIEAIDGTAVEPSAGGFAIMNKKVTPQQIVGIKKALSDLEIVLANDCQELDIYAVDTKGIYSTSALVECADKAIKSALSEDQQLCLSDDIYRDFREAGRCLAFELPTASGFHLARSVEAVVRRYWSAVSGKSFTDAPRLANCIDQLRKFGEEPKALETLEHFKDLHRNTVMHPDAFLDMGDALRLFDIAKSAIAAVAVRMAELSQATTPEME
jgi:hypothetical protein